MPDAIGSELLVNTTTQGMQKEPSVVALSTGGFVVTWTDYSQTGADSSSTAVRGQRYNASGAPVGTEFLVNTATPGEQRDPSVAALRNGGFVVIWQDLSATGGDSTGSAVRGQRYNANGTQVGAEFLVNTTTTGGQQSPRVAALSNGGFVVTWTDDSQSGSDRSSTAVRGQRYNANGLRTGTEFLINTITQGQQQNASVAALSNGGFVVTWADSSQSVGDTSRDAVRGQRYNANGVRVGTEFLVNTATTGDQSEPSVAALSNGGFVVTWTDGSQSAGDTSRDAVRGQRYNASGNRVGPEFLVNTTTQGGQQSSNVAALSTGGFVVTWRGEAPSFDDASRDDMRGQRYNANGGRVGTEFVITATTQKWQGETSVAGLRNGNFVTAWTHQGGTFDSSAFAWSEQPDVRAQIFTGTTTARMAGALVTAPLSAASTLAATSGTGGSTAASRSAPALVATSA